MAKKEATVFYSWQSDDSKTRNYVENCLKQAIKKLSSDPTLEFAPRVDKDTQGKTGAVEIAKTILEKIDVCDVFLADVSIIATSSKERHLVNQNVLFELGYAVAKVGNEDIILVANEDLGDINNLPFDIRGRRVAGFSIKKDPKGEQFTGRLQEIIEQHLSAIAEKVIVEDNSQTKSKLLEAIDQSKPTRSKAELYFSNLYDEFLALAPRRFSGGDGKSYGKEVFEHYERTKTLVIDFCEVVSVAAEYKDTNTLVAAYKKLEKISKYYDVMPEDNGHMYHVSIEFYSLVCYELTSLLIGFATREKLWDIIDEIKNTRLNRPQNFEDDRPIERLYYWPEATLAYYRELKEQNYSIPISPLLEERWQDNHDILRAYVDGSIFLFLILDEFYPWTTGIVTNSSTWKEFVPDYIKLFKSKDFLRTYTKLSESEGTDLGKDKLFEKLTKKIGQFSYHYYSLGHIFDSEGIKDKEHIGKS
jgi:hypothetical protein